MDVFIDVQGFRFNDKFIPKEIAIVSLEGPSLVTLLIKPPVNYSSLSKSEKKEVNFLERFYHGLPWYSGYMPFEDFEAEIARILKPFTGIYVKGIQKQDFLRFLNKPVFNVEDFGCPSFAKLKKETLAYRCLLHKIEFPMCALENALMICDWKENNSRCEHNRPTEIHENNDEINEDDDECSAASLRFRYDISKKR